VIQRQIQNPLATELLKGEYEPGSTIAVDSRDGEFTFEKSEDGAGQARVVASRVVT
jgi:ATP-dependent Clp protease ATP-binding subunit ClpA